jgi:hypothetical protein
MNPLPVISEKTRRKIVWSGAAVLVISVTLYLALPIIAVGAGLMVREPDFG